jgi:MAP7 domain-containing protein 1
VLQTLSDELSLFDSGSGGVAELKNKINNLEQVYIAFCRETVDLESAFLLINYIPASVSGVKRGRYVRWVSFII